MNTLLIFIWTWLAFISLSIWESSVEGRYAWARLAQGWRIKFSFVEITKYHFFLFWIMLPLLLTLPLIIYGWDLKLAGILISAYFSGLVIKDFFWYVFNPEVRLTEFYSEFSNYYPWIRINGKKIIPAYYALDLFITILSYWFIWK